jgi:hypothetical protein
MYETAPPAPSRIPRFYSIDTMGLTQTKTGSKLLFMTIACLLVFLI